MKILQLTYDLSTGGAERFVVDLCNSLEPNHVVVLVSIVNNNEPNREFYLPELSPSVRYINLQCKKGVGFQALHRICRIISVEKPDVVHAHCHLTQILLPSLIYPRIKFVHTLHSLAQRCLQWRWMKNIYKWFYQHKIKGVTISPICHESFVTLYHANCDECIYNGRTAISTTSKLQEVEFEVSKIKVHSDDIIFIHIARFHAVKNQLLLLKTFSRLINEGKHVQLIVIGGGFPNDMKEKYNQIPGIAFLGEKTNVGDYLSNAAYFVLSSLMEGLPITLLEAMSLGVIPVSTPAGGVSDVIIDGKNGFLSPSFSDDDFYNTIIRALDNKECITKDKVLLSYSENYSMKKCSGNYETLYEKLI